MLSTTRALVDAAIPRPRARPSVLLRDIAIVIGASALMALLAQLTIPLPVVPITGQTLGVLLIGAVLGSKRGALAMIAYLAEGAIGLPVFAGGAGSVVVLIGPTAGYLFSYPIAAFVVGWLCERGFDRKLFTAAVAMLAGEVVIYSIGLPWLSFYVPNGEVFITGLTPFIPGDLLKLIIAAILVPSGWKVLEKVRAP